MFKKTNKMTAYCQHCGNIFESNMVSFDNSSGDILFFDNTEPCPRCGEEAGILDGYFQITQDGKIKLLDGPSLTRDILEQLEKLAVESKTKGSSTDYFIKAANQLLNGAGDALKKIGAKTFDNKMAFFAVMLTVLGFFKSCLDDAHKDPQVNIKIENVKVENNYYVEGKPDSVTKYDISRAYEEPYLEATDFDLFPLAIGKKPEIRYKIVNHGKFPARVVRIKMKIYWTTLITEDPMPILNDYPYDTLASTTYIGTSQSNEFINQFIGDILLTKELVDLVKSRRAKTHLCGQIEYINDATGKKRVMVFNTYFPFPLGHRTVYLKNADI